MNGIKQRTYIVGGIELPPSKGEAIAFQAAEKRLKYAGLSCQNAEFSIHRRSIDARKREDIRFVYSVAVTHLFPPLSEETRKKHRISEQMIGAPATPTGKERLSGAPVVIGAGPAGLFAAWILAKNGYSPLLIDRGGSVEERKNAHRIFREQRTLNSECNIQFGAGGAGTFSDGKLVTRVSDPLTGFVLDTFYRFGAPKEILTLAKPHIGTDYLETVVSSMISDIEACGGRVLFHTRAERLLRKGNAITGIRTSAGDIPAGCVVLAPGNCARDTFLSLIGEGYTVEAKPFSVGVRVEHLQSEIDRAMHGRFADILPHAEYALSANTGERGVYTFCMCPGGEVVAAASEEGGVVTNGMSRHARDGKNANSAVLVSVFCEDYGNDPVKAIEMQRNIERAAFLSGGKNYNAPVSTVGDFLDGKTGTHPTGILPTYMGGNAFTLASPESYLPPFVTEGLKSGLRAFDRKIRGFASPTAILTGAETRTSSPLRLIRTEARVALGTDNLYPCGEGAGYAGGITSAALDGIHTAEAIMGRYAPVL